MEGGGVMEPLLRSQTAGKSNCGQLYNSSLKGELRRGFKMLLQYGARTDIIDNAGFTVMKRARIRDSGQDLATREAIITLIYERLRW
jgi:hypothetical protein